MPWFKTFESCMRRKENKRDVGKGPSCTAANVASVILVKDNYNYIPELMHKVRNHAILILT